MGVLYYFKKENADEAFALNKVYHYANEAFHEAYSFGEFRPAPENIEEWTRTWLDPSERPETLAWYLRFAQRLKSWAASSKIMLFTENDDDLADVPLTGSAHDSDYEDDGVTYKAGSAW